jgi:DNA-binding NtrC family response regulator
MESALLKRYYRLSVFTIVVPPLRQRREEIPYLIDETVRRSPAEIEERRGTQLFFPSVGCSSSL